MNQSLWFTLRLTELYSFMSFDKQINIVIYLPLQYPTEEFHCLKYLLCSPNHPFPNPEIPGND